MNAPIEAAAELVPAASDLPSALVNIDPDFHIPADAERGNGFVRAFRVLFPKAA